MKSRVQDNSFRCLSAIGATWSAFGTRSKVCLASARLGLRPTVLLPTLVLAASISGCGGVNSTGAAAGKIGRDLSSRSQAVPQSAEVCALKDAVAAQSGGPDKPMNDICGKAAKSDQLWQGAMGVLGAYAETLDGLASGGKGDTTGPLEAAMTGVVTDWVEVDDPKEKGAREAALQLVQQLARNTSGGDVGKTVKDAAPHVKTICGALVPHLEDQVKALFEIQKEIDKKRVTRADRRCGQLDSRSVCVSESIVDRAVYANLFGHLGALTDSHRKARSAVKGFCDAHSRLEEAANAGNLSDDKTYFDIVEAVKSAHKKELSTTSESASAPKK